MKIYRIKPNTEFYYAGTALVAAENADDANKFISAFKDSDKEDAGSSFGYCFVTEDDVVNYLYSKYEGIIFYGIYYTGP